MAAVRQRNAQGSSATEIEKKIKRGNALRHGSTWKGSRGLLALLLLTLLVCLVALWLFMTSLDSDITETLVSQREVISPQPRIYAVQCSEDYQNYKRYPDRFPAGGHLENPGNTIPVVTGPGNNRGQHIDAFKKASLSGSWFQF